MLRILNNSFRKPLKRKKKKKRKRNNKIIMENKKNIPSNSIYTAVYKKGKVTNEYIPLLDIKLKGLINVLKK